jgi:hypothetical protein
MRTRLALAFALTALGSCAAPAPPPPLPPSVATMPPPPPLAPVVVATPTPAPTLAAMAGNWMDAPQTPGDWFYARIGEYTYAAYGDEATSPIFSMRCDRANRLVSLGRTSAAGEERAMRVRTETASRLLAGEPRQGSVETLIATDINPNDSLLDAMAISKGRFAVEVAGEETLFLPSWPEVTRVIEDCR